MKKNLPIEVLHEIFIQLSLSERLECTLVSRYWYNALSSYSLLYNVQITNEQMFNKFMEMIQRVPSRATQVEILSIKIKNTVDKWNISKIFPNLRIFNSHMSAGKFTSSTSVFSWPFEYVNSVSKLEEIHDEDECKFARQMLVSTLCTKLRRLELEFVSNVNFKKDILVYLKNAPNLKEIVFSCGDIGIEDLEILRKNLPTLKSLDLTGVTIYECKLPRDIIPATSVTDFTISPYFTGNVGNYANLYEYFAKKYTNLTHFLCEDNILCDDIDPSHIIDIYRNGIIPLYKSIGSYVDQLRVIKTPVELDFFNKMDDFGCRFKSIRLEFNEDNPIFDQLGKSNQPKSVECLELEDTAITSPSLLQNFTSLTTLDIDMISGQGYWPIDLTDCLNAFPPSLTSFSVCCSDLEIMEIPTRTNNIEKLLIGSNYLSKKLAKAISTCFPKLDDLSLHGLVTENLIINIPNAHLKKYTIGSIYTGEESHGFLVTSVKDSHHRYYINKEKPGRPNFLPAEPTTLEDIKNRVTIYLTCATVKNVNLRSSYNGPEYI